MGSTIFVSNHAASFMDPLIVGALKRQWVFFLTRSDIFNAFTKPVLWLAHMLPIYREHDGGNTKDLNEKTFITCSRVLKYGRNLLIFGEGFTDDTFIRRLKPIKKGAARIGFNTLERLNWEKDIYIAAIGINYTNPNQRRSDVLISTSEKFLLNDYKELFLSNPNKAINDVTLRIEKLMQSQITHIEDVHNAKLHESIMMITRKGMHPDSFDRNLTLEERYNYSQNLAKWINTIDANDEKIVHLKSEIESYIHLLKKLKITDHQLFTKVNQLYFSSGKSILFLLLLAPFALLGSIHVGLPYIFIKRFIEKSFKRKVFWGSVKLLFGVIIFGLLNIPVIFLIKHYIYPSYLLGFAYYLCIGLFVYATDTFIRILKTNKIYSLLDKLPLNNLAQKRAAIAKLISEVLPNDPRL